MTKQRQGGQKEPYTTAVMDGGELHFIVYIWGRTSREAPIIYRASCGLEGGVTNLKDRTAKELAEENSIRPTCPLCFTVAWQYHLLREARADEPTSEIQA